MATFNQDIRRAPCANTYGFSVRAGVRYSADSCCYLEQLRSYIARSALANELGSDQCAKLAILSFEYVFAS